jgi:hypothetical protein
MDKLWVTYTFKLKAFWTAASWNDENVMTPEIVKHFENHPELLKLNLSETMDQNESEMCELEFEEHQSGHFHPRVLILAKCDISSTSTGSSSCPSVHRVATKILQLLKSTFKERTHWEIRLNVAKEEFWSAETKG